MNELVNTNSDIIQRPELSQSVANIYLLNNEYDKAQELFLNSLKLGSNSWMIMKQLTVISLEKNEFEKAEEYIETSFKFANSSFEMSQSYHLKALISYNRSDYENCIKRCKKGITEIKNKDDHYIKLIQLLEAKSLLKLQEISQAKKLIDSIIEEDPEIKNIVIQDSELKDLL